MKTRYFVELNSIQKRTMITAMIIRNEIEDFHVKHLTDKQMAELNPLIRQAIFNAFTLLDKAEKNEDDGYMVKANDLVRMTPDYWEVPDKITSF